MKVKVLIGFIIFLLLNSHVKATTSCLHSQVRGQGQALLLMPGFVSDETVWQSVADELAKNYQVHLLAIAGFGKHAPCVYAKNIIQQIEKETLHYIKSNSLHKPIFIGHSMGGLMAFKLALKQNTSLAGAISVDGLPFIGPVFTRTNSTQVADIMHQAKAVKTLYESATEQQLQTLTKTGLATQTRDKNNYPQLISMAKHSDPVTAGSAIYSIMTTDLRADLSALNKPVLLLGASGAFNLQHQHQGARALYHEQVKHAAHVRLSMNTRGRHFLMWDEPNWLINKITEFAKEQA